jgi:hypothetical protein
MRESDRTGIADAWRAAGGSLYVVLDEELRNAGADELIVTSAGGQTEGYSRAGMQHGRRRRREERCCSCGRTAFVSLEPRRRRLPDQGGDADRAGRAGSRGC